MMASSPASSPAADSSLAASAATEEQRREKQLEEQLDLERLPAHVAIIMDGNGRWAKSQGLLNRIRGHEAGVDSVRAAAENCARLHLRALTLYAFSRENWQRPQIEIAALMTLLKRFLVGERPTLMKNNIRLWASGALDDLPDAVRETLDETLRLTENNTGMALNLALSYSGREEIATAARRLARQVAQGTLAPDDITIEKISENLYSPTLGDPDLLIRTSGEFRISNFLLWQLAYTEIYITNVFWPDFRLLHLLEALVDFQGRDRRYGKVKES